MATQSATFTFALPEDVDSDQLVILEATTKAGTYSTVATISYEYGTTVYEYDSLDDTRWYKVKFSNSTDSEDGPISDPVYGGDFANAAPFLAISTKYDGANYATIQDVYDYSSLTTSDVSTGRVSQALRRARAVIDLKTADLDLDRFTMTFNSDTSRKKYNATLRIVKEAEINIALGNVYRGISDDLVAMRLREALVGTDESGAVHIGQTSLSTASGLDPRHMAEMNALANRYLSIGAAMLNALQPPTIRVHSESWGPLPKFKYPFNGF
jgi:hypothetical protein